MSSVRLAIAAALLFAAAVPARAADEATRTASATGIACSCRACDEPVCCRAPTGFAPLDQKCATRCRDQQWTGNADQTCAGSRPTSCCPGN